MGDDQMGLATLLITVISSLCTVYLVYNVSKGIDPLYVLTSFILTISCLGYYLYVSATNYESAMFANAVSYLGGIFLPMIMLFMLSTFSGTKLPSWFKVFIILSNLFIYVLVLLSYRFRIYYSASLFAPDSPEVLDNTPGVGYYIRIIILVVEVVLCVFFTSLTFSGKKTASRRIMWFFMFFMMATILGYGLTTVSHLNKGFVSCFFMLCNFGLVNIATQFQLYNVTDNVIGNAIITLDRKFRLTGYNDDTVKIFPEFNNIKIDSDIITDSYALKEIMRWVKKNAPAIKGDDVLSKEFVINDNNLEANRHVKCNVSALSFGIKNVVSGYLLEFIDETEQVNYINQLNYTGVRLKKEADRQTKRAENLQSSIILGMAAMIESRDDSTGGHINRTSACVQLFVEHIQESHKFMMSDLYWANVIHAAPLHDLGKIAVDDRVLKKQGQLNPDEYEQMKKHAEVGAEIVQQVLADVDDKEFVRIASNVAHYHHEKYNGTGYPEGLKGNQIPLEARVMALADVFDALISKRYYKNNMSYDEAFAIIRNDLGTHFDPELGKIFLSMKPDLIKLYDRFTGVDDPNR